MAAFPSSYARVLADGFQESHSPIADRGQMDRGLPKQRKLQSDVVVTVSMKLAFFTPQAAQDFENWYYSEAEAGAVFFDWTHPRTGTMYQARVVANSLGELTQFGAGSFARTCRTVQLEYLKPL